AVILLTRSSARPSSREVQFDIETGATTDLQSMAMSPDGARIVFVDTSNGEQRLWVRAFDSLTSRLVEHTEDARYPFWSPDSRSVGFFSAGLLKKLDIASGSIQTLAPAPRGLGGTWNADGVILYAPTFGGLWRINQSGGTPPTAVTTPGSAYV